MSARVPLPQRDYSVLSPMALKMIKRRSKPEKPDYEAIADRERRQRTHATMRTLVGGWKNTIASNRIDRQTRLQREAEAEEQRRVAIDEEEKRIRKLKRQAELAEAQKAEFAQRPEVRAVNAQLLQAEVQMENEHIQAVKERKKLEEMRKQVAFDEQYRQEYEKMCANEDRIRKERRERARQVAEEFKRQKVEKEERREREKEENMIDEQLIAQQMQLELKREEEERLEKQRKMKQDMLDNARQNELIMRYKEKMKDVEKEENRRLRELFAKTLDEQDERRAAEEKRKNDRLNARQALIDAEAKRQMETKKAQQDFLDKQQREQYEKDRKALEELAARRQRLQEERKRDYLEAMALKEQKKKEKLERTKNKSKFPNAKELEEDRLFEQRLLERKKITKDVYDFRLKQMQEKKEREAAEKERARLEYQKMLDDDAEYLAKAQAYAKTVLGQAEQDNDDLQYYNY